MLLSFIASAYFLFRKEKLTRSCLMKSASNLRTEDQSLFPPLESWRKTKQRNEVVNKLVKRDSSIVNSKRMRFSRYMRCVWHFRRIGNTSFMWCFRGSWWFSIWSMKRRFSLPHCRASARSFLMCCLIRIRSWFIVLTLMGRSASGEGKSKHFMFPSYSCNIWPPWNLNLTPLNNYYNFTMRNTLGYLGN